jgi:hypothetical protein
MRSIFPLFEKSVSWSGFAHATQSPLATIIVLRGAPKAATLYVVEASILNMTSLLNRSWSVGGIINHITHHSQLGR